MTITNISEFTNTLASNLEDSLLVHSVKSTENSFTIKNFEEMIATVEIKSDSLCQVVSKDGRTYSVLPRDYNNITSFQMAIVDIICFFMYRK